MDVYTKSSISVTTVGDLRQAITDLPDDMPLSSEFEYIRVSLSIETSDELTQEQIDATPANVLDIDLSDDDEEDEDGDDDTAEDD